MICSLIASPVLAQGYVPGGTYVGPYVRGGQVVEGHWRGPQSPGYSSYGVPDTRSITESAVPRYENGIRVK